MPSVLIPKNAQFQDCRCELPCSGSARVPTTRLFFCPKQGRRVHSTHLDRCPRSLASGRIRAGGPGPPAEERPMPQPSDPGRDSAPADSGTLPTLPPAIPPDSATLSLPDNAALDPDARQTEEAPSAGGPAPGRGAAGPAVAG